MRTFVALTVALLACGGPLVLPVEQGPDGGALPDNGVLPSDGGAPADAGEPPPPPPPPPPPTASGPTLAGCAMLPPTNAWNQDISADAIDPHSADYLAFMNAGSLYLQPDFGGPYGQPFMVVPSSQPRVSMSFLYASQSDPGPYPFPQDLPIQPNEDRHATVLVQDECRIYETYNTWSAGSGYRADSGAMFDLVSGTARPDGWTSATAAGLPILPGLVRYDEAVEKGEIAHALTIIAGATAHKYVGPATHSSGTSSAEFAPPMGLRLRLRADFDLSRYHGASLAVLRALRKYGMFVTDNAGGQFWSVNGAYDTRWPIQDLEQLKTVPASAFEVVKLGTVHTGQ